MSRRRLVILGSTGTIGVNALKLVEQYPDRFEVIALTAGRNLHLLSQQIQKFAPQQVAIQRQEDLASLRQLLGDSAKTELLAGDEAIVSVAAQRQADVVVSAIVGFAGVRPTLAAIETGKIVALANKEAIVAAGPILLDALKKSGAMLIPVDSEHSAIFQALNAETPYTHAGKNPDGLRRLILTASGGPFLHWEQTRLQSVTPEQALKHPTWQMGAKISIDSATMMNKGLEVIEATRLFDIPATQVDIVIHPESIIHSMIEYVDGSLIAQLGITDMRGPLAYAMAYPQRLDGALGSLNLAQVSKLTFMEPDFDRFPCLRLAYHAAKIGDSVPAVLNAANEICVKAFLDRRINFLDIPQRIGKVLEIHTPVKLRDIEQVCEIDNWARLQTGKLIGEF